MGKLTEEEAEIVALNAKLDILKHKSPKKQHNKMKQDNKKSPTLADKKKDEDKKQDKKKADFCQQKARPNQKK